MGLLIVARPPATKGLVQLFTPSFWTVSGGVVRLAKSQQMRWLRRGANLLLQVRCPRVEDRLTLVRDIA
jgi:hypothetical protein